MTDPELQIIRISPDQNGGWGDITELGQYTSLIWRMAHRQFRLHIGGSVINMLWPFIRPAIMTLALIYLRRMSGANFGSEVPYPLYVFSGLCIWFFFQELTVGIASSLTANANLMQKVYYPVLINPLALVLSRLPDLLLILLAIGVFQFLQGVGISSAWYLLPVALVLLLLLAVGIGLMFSAFMLASPNARRILEVMLYLGLFLSPIIFSLNIYPEQVRDFFVLNPMTGLLSGLRGALFAGSPMDLFAFAVGSGMTLLLFLSGALLFLRAQNLVREDA